MKAVLISIQPKYVELIARGKKTVEVRKTRPKIETPFKCYIITISGAFGLIRCPECSIYHRAKEYDCNGKVIGEFTCDKIDSYIFERNNRFWWGLGYKAWQNLKDKSCLTIEQIIDYTGDSNTLYGWHISDLKIYDEPRELGEFKKENKCYKKGDLDNIGCWERGCPIQEQGWCDGRFSKITRPPQSLCYVEV